MPINSNYKMKLAGYSGSADLSDIFVELEQFADSGAFSCGYNVYGQLGNNIAGTDYSSPVQIGSLTDWREVSVGTYHELFIKNNGTLWSCGYNNRGQLGDNTTTNKSSPVQIGVYPGWKQVSAGSTFSAAVTEDGKLWTWGRNAEGQLGLNNILYYSSPVQVGALTNWQQVACGYRCTYAIKTDGTLWAWGNNRYGQLGLDNTVYYSSPVQVGSLTSWKSLASYSPNAKYLLALQKNNTMWACGSNQSGELGINTTTSSYSSPVQIGSLTEWVSISAGVNTAFAIKKNGTLWAWGYGVDGQIAIGTNQSYSSPVQIGTQTNWKQVSAGSGFGHVHALKTNGTLWAWGRNDFGQLGNNTTAYYSSPIQIGSLTTWKQVSAGFNSSVMITLGDWT